MATIEKTVFISYRRTDVYAALAVYQDLSRKGYDVFFDYSSISSGDFEQIIISNINARAHFLLILTPTALDRCEEPGDWLRREIETAIDEQRNIVPLFFKGFNFSDPMIAEKLTGKLSTLGRYNGLNVHEDYFPAAMDRLTTQFLNVPLNTVLHPVSTEVRKAVKQEQIAVNKVLEKWQDFKELFSSAEETSIEAGKSHIDTLSQVKLGKSLQNANFGFYGIVIVILGVIALAFASKWLQNSDRKSALTMTSPAVANTIGVESSFTSSVGTEAAGFTSPIPSETTTIEVSTITITPSPKLGVGSTRIAPKDGMILLYIPAGEFIMGSNDDDQNDNPEHKVNLKAFWIDQTDVTNAMYAKCHDAGGCKQLPSSTKSNTQPVYYGNPDFDSFPVIYVSWQAAKDYCEWANRRLPTEAEWEKAARGDDRRTYPWGNEPPNNDRLNFNHQVQDTTKVGAYPDGASPYGALDMAGNVWNWVADWYEFSYYSKSRTSNPPGPTTATEKVLRGGAWSYAPEYATTTRRVQLAPSVTSYDIGFRCASDE